MSGSDRDNKNSEELAEERTELAEERTDEAQDRSEWAMDRTALANERTFIAWLRTAMASIGVGLGVAELLPRVDGELVASTIGVLLILLGGAMAVLGWRRYHRVSSELEATGFDIHPVWMVHTIVIGLGVASALAIIFVLMK